MKKLIAILLFPMAVNAEPGAVTQYLITEPATLLDVGMVRLDSLTNAFQERVGLHWSKNGELEAFRADVNSYYEPDDDRFYVSFLIMNNDATYAQMAEGCKMAMDQMGIWLMKSLPGLFLHVAHDNSSRPRDLGKAFQEMFVLRCYVSSARDTSEGRFWASRSLMDRAMTVGRWDVTN